MKKNHWIKEFDEKYDRDLWGSYEIKRIIEIIIDKELTLMLSEMEGCVTAKECRHILKERILEK